MERDFLGLLTVKEENAADAAADSARGRESPMQWSFANNVSGPAQYLSFRGSQEDRPRKNLNDRFDAAAAQKVVLIEKSAAGTHYPIPAYPLQQFPSHSIGRSHEARMYPQQAGLPPVSVLPAAGSMIGSTDLRSGGSKQQHAAGPAQLTIFYAGSVCVFDNISLEKAQAVMLLAGNGQPASPHHKKPATDEAPSGNMAHTPAFLSLPGSVSQLPAKPTCNSLNLATVTTSIGPLQPAVIARQEPPKVIQSVGSSSAPLFSTVVALPQARKASLARFLEKRKERTMSASPYPVGMRSPESSISKVSDN